MKRRGPDSLNSWIIAAGCCFINMMMFGMARLSGVLFVASVPRFNITREQASFPYTLSQATRNTSGPLVGYLGQKFGVRFITSIGCLIASLGIATCYLAEDINTITVLWGIIFGLGFGMGNILLPISINQYFDKKRATASGISFSGACIGSFAIPPIVEFLINSYGLSGTFLFLGGFVLNCLPVALLLRKPDFTITKQKQNSMETQSITDGKKVKLYTVESTILTDKNQSSATIPEKPPLMKCHDGKNTILNADIYSKSSYSSKYLTDRHNLSKNTESVTKNDVSQTTNSTLTYDPILCKTEKTDYTSHNLKSNPNTQLYLQRSASTSTIKPLTTDDDTYSNSYQGYYSNSAFKPNFNIEKSSSFAPSVTASSDKEETKSVLKSFDVIFDPIFILIALTNAVYSAMFVCMITVIVDFAKDINVGETNEKFIIMSLSVGDLIGRLGLGWITDGGYMTRSNFAALCFFCQGITTIAMAWSTGFTMLLIMAALYGLSEAGLILIFPLIVAEYIEEEKQTVAIPTSYFLSGPLCLTVAPLIGFFRDDIGSYEDIFYGIGVISFVCTMCWLLAPCIARCRRNR